MKTIQQLAQLVEGATIIGDKETIITGIEHDSRKAEAGTLFVCIKGVHVDGHKFISQAVNAGAKAILTTREKVEVPAGVAILRVPDLNKALDTIVPYFHDYPARSMRIIGITGTNGKTTTRNRKFLSKTCAPEPVLWFVMLGKWPDILRSY